MLFEYRINQKDMYRVAYRVKRGDRPKLGWWGESIIYFELIHCHFLNTHS